MKDNKIKLATLIPIFCSVIMAFTSVCQVILTLKRDIRNYEEEKRKYSTFMEYNNIKFKLYSSFTLKNDDVFSSYSYTKYYIPPYPTQVSISGLIVYDVSYCHCLLFWYNMNKFYLCYIIRQY